MMVRFLQNWRGFVEGDTADTLGPDVEDRLVRQGIATRPASVPREEDLEVLDDDRELAAALEQADEARGPVLPGAPGAREAGVEAEDGNDGEAFDPTETDGTLADPGPGPEVEADPNPEVEEGEAEKPARKGRAK